MATMIIKTQEEIQKAEKIQEKYCSIRKVISLCIHCIDCDEEDCRLMPYCLDFQDLLVHQEECIEKKCTIRFGAAHCNQTKQYIRHCIKCQKVNCPVCAPLRVIWPEDDEDLESFAEHLEAFEEFTL